MSQKLFDNSSEIPVVAIDGISGCGKSTAGKKIAQILGFHYLDSGLNYRGLGLICARQHISVTDPRLPKIAERMNLIHEGDVVLLDDEDVTDVLHSKTVNDICKEVSQVKGVRAAFRCKQLAMRKPPGLVAVGRDMWEIFGTECCFYLHASAAKRAQWRVKQSQNTDHPLEYKATFEALKARDKADCTRTHSPLTAHPDAVDVNTGEFTQEGVVEFMLEKINSKGITVPSLV